MKNAIRVDPYILINKASYPNKAEKTAMRNKVITYLMILICMTSLSANAQEADKILKEISDMHAAMTPIVGTSTPEVNAKWKINTENQPFEPDAPAFQSNPFPDSKPLKFTKYVPEIKKEFATPKSARDESNVLPAANAGPEGESDEDAPVELPNLIESNFRGYNIVKFKKLFYGIDLSEGPIDVADITSKSKYKWFSSDSLNTVKSKIEKEGKPPLTLSEKIGKRLKSILGMSKN